ncbi:hypothetical protein [Vagococcus fluvialis]|nr:hypothetical protein [Vagococcus fluvialis]
MSMVLFLALISFVGMSVILKVISDESRKNILIRLLNIENKRTKK